jgi:hypothetical protein
VFAIAYVVTARERVVRDDVAGPIVWLQPEAASHEAAEKLMATLLSGVTRSQDQQVSRANR